MATVKEFLDSCGFDWDTGVVFIQPTEDGSPGWSSPSGPMHRATQDDLTSGFDSGYRGPECPRYIAEDKEAIYFPSQYDGSTCGEKVLKDIRRYGPECPTPYPG